MPREFSARCRRSLLCSFTLLTMLGAEAAIEFLSRCRRSSLRLELGRKDARAAHFLCALLGSARAD